MRQRTKEFTRYVTTIAMVMGLHAITTTGLEGQTRFSRPDTTVDLSRHTTVDDCLAATGRVERDEENKPLTWKDTTEQINSYLLDSTPAATITIARICSEKFDPASVPLENKGDLAWIKLFLLARRDDAAETVIARVYAAAKAKPPEDTHAMYNALSAVAGRYGDVRPVRWDKYLEISGKLTVPGVARDSIRLMKVYALRFDLARRLNDTVVQRRAGERIVQLSKTLTPQEREDRWYRVVGRHEVAAALDYFVSQALRDSLRRSPSAYIALRRANWMQANANKNEPFTTALGEKAPPIVANFWFTGATATPARTTAGPNTDGSDPAPVRPSQGKVSLVLFLRGGCREDAPAFFREIVRVTQRAACWGTYAALRRFATRYPQVEITIVSHTMGYVGESPIISPEEEAKTLQAWWLGFHRLPATLAITSTEFFRMPNTDFRRVDHAVANNVAYGFDRGEAGQKLAFLIDADGTVLHVNSLDRGSEEGFRELLDVVLNR